MTAELRELGRRTNKPECFSPSFPTRKSLCHQWLQLERLIWSLLLPGNRGLTHDPCPYAYTFLLANLWADMSPLLASQLLFPCLTKSLH